jgi:DNA-binding protein HU-beta
MNKTELVSEFASRVGTTKTDAAEYIDAIFNPDTGIIATALRNDGKLALPGFGTFALKNTPARSGVSPLNGKPYNTPASRTAKFSVGATLKNNLTA